MKNLEELAILHGTDKTGSHNYMKHYELHLKKIRNKKINLLEIGVGGYDNPNEGGHSLRMWKDYFHNGNIFGIDIFNKQSLEEERIKIFHGDQVDGSFLNKIVNDIGEIDVIIDDGSHINKHVIATFNLLFPKLKDGGVYIVEDVQTSYWKDYGGNSDDLNNPSTMMNFFKSLTDCLNHVEFIKPGYKPTYFDMNITEMHFYHNMIFIQKGKNDEKSNMIFNNT